MSAYVASPSIISPVSGSTPSGTSSSTFFVGVRADDTYVVWGTYRN